MGCNRRKEQVFMLEKINLNQKLSKKEANTLLEQYGSQLSSLQRTIRELQIPVIILFEGWGASGKGTLINQFIRPLDPRGFQVFTIQKPNEEEIMRPFLWRFWTKTPAKGRIHLFDRSWYQKVLEQKENNMFQIYEDITNFEEQLTCGGTVIIKFFLHISKEEQKKRFQKLEQSKETAWRVTKRDWHNYKQYEQMLSIYDDMLIKTDTSNAPWTIIEAANREYASVKIMSHVIEQLKQAVYIQKTAKEIKQQEKVENIKEEQFQNRVLSQVDLSKTMGKEEYKKKLKQLQKELSKLHSEMYQKRVPVILAFEGWDAGGKGGAIKRITEPIDPRGYEVIPTASPNDIERAHHYLWRFWEKIPKAGHLAIFDRTWYGRVMVERIEQFCTEDEWQRAYNEINHMEEHLTNFGCIVLKFWMHIDKEEQKRRFEDRQQTPQKQWKITEEDWRNRAKWDEYESAVNEMLVRTSTKSAPWIIVEANSKYYARIKVLETIVDTLKKRLNA